MLDKQILCFVMYETSLQNRDIYKNQSKQAHDKTMSKKLSGSNFTKTLAMNPGSKIFYYI